MTPALIVLALAVSTPTSEAKRLGRKLAEHGTLASLLPVMEAKETDELLAEEPTLTSAQKARLRIIAKNTFQASYDRLMTATGDAYAKQLSEKDLRALARFYQSPVAARYQAATPIVIVASMQAVGKLDFKGDVRKAFCAESKRLCPN